jgi:lipoprotein NlpD
MCKKIILIIGILLNISCTSVNVATGHPIAHRSFLYKITKKNALAEDFNKQVKAAPQTLLKPKPEQVTVKPPKDITPKSFKHAKVPGWNWPVVLKNVKVVQQKNGIDILGQADAEVYAARAGEVVYSGEALRGYGKLIIIKHDNNYLTAYGHNDKVFVLEGQKIAIGQKIATMGNSGTEHVKLHFEVRHFGKPVDPSTVLSFN